MSTLSRAARPLAVSLSGLSLVMAMAPAVAAAAPPAQALNPEPPDFYTCKAVGAGTICDAHTIEPYELEPTGIVCGSGPGAFEIVDSGTRDVRATRWYDGDGNWTRRIRTFLFRDTRFTNPLTGQTLPYAQHNTDVDEFAVPGDLSTDTFTGHGHLSITFPGLGNVLNEAGRTVVGPTGDVESQSGPSELSDYYGGDAALVADLCAALGA